MNEKDRRSSYGTVPTHSDLYAVAGSGRRRWVTVREVAEALSTTPRTVYRMIESGELPGVKFGEGRRQNVRIPVEALDDWIAAKESEAKEITKSYGSKARLG